MTHPREIHKLDLVALSECRVLMIIDGLGKKKLEQQQRQEVAKSHQIKV